MRYSQETKYIARDLRSKGWSLGQIHKQLKIPITTIALWVSDVRLSESQRESLKERIHEALQAGRVRAQSEVKQKRYVLEQQLFGQGLAEIDVLTRREQLLVGVALYWAEGFNNKHERRLGFCNSDPNMIRFYLKWLEECFGVSKKNVVARLTLNEAYRDKVKEIQHYWSETTGISQSQFTKPFYQHVKWKRKYFDTNYHGVLRIHVNGSLELLLKMKGWIAGLKVISQGSSAG